MAPTKKAASMSLKATEALSVAITSLRRGRGTVLKFHHNTIENSHHWSNVKKVENKRLIGTKNISTGDLVKEGVCNLTSSTSHHHLQWMRICLVVLGEFEYLNWRSGLHSPKQTSSRLESILLLHEAQQIYDTATVAKLVVIPRDKFDKCVGQLDTSLGIKYGRSLVPSEIGGDNVLIAVTHNTLHWTLRSILDSLADVLV